MLQELGFEPYGAAECVFVKHKGSTRQVVLVVYVDDLLVVGDDIDEVERGEENAPRKVQIDRSWGAAILPRSQICAEREQDAAKPGRVRQAPA